VRTTLLRGFGRNHSLCHGDLGDESLSTSVTATACKVLASIEQDGWICRLPSGVESPALMNGFTGIGYGLLRQAVPDQLPSVLSLEPPLTDSR
jgi:lantibiotic modifying enzyme